MLEWKHSVTWKPSYLKATPADHMPRALHYHFARSALPCIFYSGPSQLLEQLSGPESAQFLNQLWNDVGAQVVEASLGVELPGSGLSADPVTLETCHGVVVHMPTAERAGECVHVLLLTPPAVAVPGRSGRSIWNRIASLLPDFGRTGSKPDQHGVWEMLRAKGAPVARCFALELVPDVHPGELSPKIAEFSTAMGCVRTGYGDSLDSGEFIRTTVDCLDV